MAKTFSEAYYGKNFDKTAKKLKDDRSENRIALEFNLRGLNLEEIDLTDIKQVVERCSYYFQCCAEDGIRPGVAGMCVWLGVERKRWQKWCMGQEFKTTHQRACCKINGIFEAMLESYSINGKINPVTGIYLLKNNHEGYYDNPPVQDESKQTPIRELSEEYVLQLAAAPMKKTKKSAKNE